MPRIPADHFLDPAFAAVLDANLDDIELKDGQVLQPEEELEEAVSQTVATAAPALVVGLGGFGLEVARRVKHRNPEGAYLVADLERRKQDPSPPYPGFANSEFVFLDRRRVKLLFLRPNESAHRPTFLRVPELEGDGAGARTVRSQVAGLLHRVGAGQERAIGFATLAACWRRFATKVTAVVTRLFARARPEGVEGGVAPAAGPKRVFVIASVGGGTGSSLVKDVAAWLRQEIPGADITGLLAMPSVSDEWNQEDDRHHKVAANAVATLREIGHVQSGRAHAEGHVLDVAGTKIACPERLFDTAYLVERRDARDLDLEHDEVVMAEVAEFVSSMIETPALAGGFEVGEAQDRGLNGVEAPFSSLGASSLEVPVARLTRLLAYGQGIAWIHGALAPLGKKEPEAVAADAAAYLESAGLDGDADLAPQLRASVPDTADALEDLRRSAAREEKRDLEQRLVEFRDDWVDRGVRDLDSAVVAEKGRWTEAAKAKVLSKLDAATASKRLAVAKAWAEALCNMLAERSCTLDGAAEGAALARQECEAELARCMASLRGWRGFFAGGRAKRRAVTALQRLVAAHTNERILVAAKTALAAVGAAAGERAQALANIVTAAQSARRNWLRGLRKNLEPAHCHGVIDVTSRSFSRAFLAANVISAEAFAPKVLEGRTPADLAAGLSEALWHAAVRHARSAVEPLAVVDLLASQLASPDERPRTAALVKLWVETSLPLLGAAAPATTDGHFTFYLRWTLPGGAELPKPLAEEIQRHIDGLTDDRFGPPDIGSVPSQDRHRLVMCTRAHGIALTMLPTLRDCRGSYAALTAGQALLHVHSADMVSKMEMPIADDAQEAAAATKRLYGVIGVAYGFVAGRGGAVYYENIEREPGRKGAFVIPSSPLWPCCIGFDESGKPLATSSLERMRLAGRLRFDQKPMPDTQLGEGGYENALAALSDDFVETIRDAYKGLLGAVGDTVVAKELEEYAGRVARGETRTPQAAVRATTELLRAEIRRLEGKK